MPYLHIHADPGASTPNPKPTPYPIPHRTPTPNLDPNTNLIPTLTSASSQAAACRASAAVVELLLTTAPEVAEWRGLQNRLPLSLALLCEVSYEATH